VASQTRIRWCHRCHAETYQSRDLTDWPRAWPLVPFTLISSLLERAVVPWWCEGCEQQVRWLGR
jgi:hypothetical protein